MSPQIEFDKTPITTDDEYNSSVAWLAQMDVFLYRGAPGFYVVIPRDLFIAFREFSEYVREQIAQYEKDHNGTL